jgi:hypothetical protein
MLLFDFYVDDQVSSIQNEQNAVQLVQDLRNVLQCGGFKLTKFVSNSEIVLKSVPQEDLIDQQPLDQSFVHSVLGLKWVVQKDHLCFPCLVPDRDSIPTRRLFLSIVAKVYDPLGVVAPAILPGKVVLQQSSSLDWDETDDFLNAKWPIFHELILCVSQFSFSRCFVPSNFSRSVHVSLHGFADASQDGYAAVVYVRQVDNEGSVCVSFVQGKSRVAPKFKGKIPQATIPKLELKSAALMAKLVQKVKRCIGIPVDEWFFLV